MSGGSSATYGMTCSRRGFARDVAAAKEPYRPTTAKLAARVESCTTILRSSRRVASSCVLQQAMEPVGHRFEVLDRNMFDLEEWA